MSECDREVSIMRRFWPTGGCCATGRGGGETTDFYDSDDVFFFLP